MVEGVGAGNPSEKPPNRRRLVGRIYRTDLDDCLLGDADPDLDLLHRESARSALSLHFCFPVPLTPNPCGRLLALSSTVAFAPTVPAVVGAKVRVMVHFPLGGTWPVQVVNSENSLDPLRPTPLKVMLWPPFFFAVLVRVTTLVLVLPIFTLPKFTEVGETLTVAATVGAGVGAGV